MVLPVLQDAAREIITILNIFFMIAYITKKRPRLVRGLEIFYAANFSFFRFICVTNESKAQSNDSSKDLEDAFTKKL